MYAPYHMYSTQVSIRSLHERVSMWKYPRAKYRYCEVSEYSQSGYSGSRRVFRFIYPSAKCRRCIERRLSTRRIAGDRWRSLVERLLGRGYSRMADPTVIVVVSVGRAARYGGAM